MKTWMEIRTSIPMHLNSFIEKLSSEHPSGISLSQLDLPMMRQFKAAKEEVPDALLFFRMGDFYELFGLDAIIASDICDLTLTSRDKSRSNPVPMAGIPVVHYKVTLKKCLDVGFKVAVCDQVEDPRCTKGIVKREITRIATPAVPGDLESEESTNIDISGNYLASILQTENLFTFSYIDVSTGEFRLTSKLNIDELKQEVLTIKPKEILTTGTLEKKIQVIVNDNHHHSFTQRILINRIESWILKSDKACKNIFLEFFCEKDLHAFGLSSLPGALTCVAALLFYIKHTQRNIFKNIHSISYYDVHNYLILDESTKKNLDLFLTSTGQKHATLLTFLNDCHTILGSRALYRRLHYPFKEQREIQDALDFVDEFTKEQLLCREVQSILSQCSDIEKILSRACHQSLDVKSSILLKNTLNLMNNFLSFGKSHKDLLPIFFSYSTKYNIENLLPLIIFLNSALNTDVSHRIGTGPSVFIAGYSKELDELISLENNFSQKLKELENRERANSKIPTLKIGFTRVFGYYFEISRGKLSQTPKHFIRKQTLTNAERFVTPELKQLEEQSLSASDKRLILERELFENIRLKIIQFSKEISQYAEFIANIDLTTTFAYLANKYSWCKPSILPTPTTTLIDCAHPVMKHQNSVEEEFISNTIEFHSQEQRIHLITGPNMAGKSTLMRQVAVNQILFQIGSFVCAKTAKIGITDRILSRIGSSDYATKNQSTFMVEMLETAQILKMSTTKSLLLLDEVGRGTSTYDGLALAWAILEEIHDTKAPRTLFSTHYHELVEICQQKPSIYPMQMGVIIKNSTDSNGNTKEDLIFSRKYLPGFIGKSFGLSVAALAGIPQNIISRAGQILTTLEQKTSNTDSKINKPYQKLRPQLKSAQQNHTLF